MYSLYYTLKWNKLHKTCKKSFRHCNRNHSSGTRHVVPQAVYNMVINIEQFVNEKSVQVATDYTIN